MGIEKAVRDIYQKRPYPGVSGSMVRKPEWHLAPVAWMKAVWPPLARARKILVAGCGSGNEAFAIRSKFPDCEIVGADFSPRPIAVARQLQKKYSKRKPIRFVVADLTSAGFADAVGTGFDFISCNGVITYIPRPERVFRNFARVLNDDGAAYLGLNGRLHFSRRWRGELDSFGFDHRKFEDSAKLRETLQLLGRLDADLTGVADETAPYLASDLFGPLFHNLPLGDWLKPIRRGGLHFVNTHSVSRRLRMVLNHRSHRLLFPRSPAQACELIERLDESSFHKLIVSRRPPPSPPWEEPDDLLDWRPRRTPLFTLKLPKPGPDWRALRRFVAKSRTANAVVEWKIPQWQIEILRTSKGKQSLREIIREFPIRPPKAELRRQLYIFYLLSLLNLERPAK